MWRWYRRCSHESVIPRCPRAGFESSRHQVFVMKHFVLGVTVAAIAVGTLDRRDSVRRRVGAIIHALGYRNPHEKIRTLGEYSIVGPLSVSSGPTPRTSDGRPNLSGVWYAQHIVHAEHPTLRPWAQALVAQRSADHGKDFPGARCLPRGITMMGTWSVFRLVQTDALLMMVFEDDVVPRQVFMDGRGHPADLEPTWVGHSIGRWDGDTLVIDTVGFNDKSWLDDDWRPHSDKMHVIERWRRPDRSHLEIQMRIEDPDTFVRSWVTQRVSTLAPTEEVREFVCNENNQDVTHLGVK